MPVPDPAKPAPPPGRPSLLPAGADAGAPRLRMLGDRGDEAAAHPAPRRGAYRLAWHKLAWVSALIVGAGTLAWAIGRPPAGDARPVVPSGAAPEGTSVATAPVQPPRMARVEPAPAAPATVPDDARLVPSADANKLPTEASAAPPAAQPSLATPATPATAPVTRAAAPTSPGATTRVAAKPAAKPSTQAQAKRQQLAKTRRTPTRDVPVASAGPAARQATAAKPDPRSAQGESPRSVQARGPREAGPSGEDPDAALIGAVMAHLKRKPGTATAAARTDAATGRRGD